MKMNENEELGKHFIKVDKIIRELKEGGVKIEEPDAVCHLLLTLPKRYEMIVTTLESLPQKKLTLEYVKGRLLNEELKYNQGEVDEKHGEERETNAFSAKFKFKCYNCNKYGHKKSQCKFLKKNENKFNKFDKRYDKHYEKRQFAGKTSTESVSFMSKYNTDQEVSRKWVLDSGASQHMTNNEEILSNVTIFENPLIITVAKSGENLISKKKRRHLVQIRKRTTRMFN